MKTKLLKLATLVFMFVAFAQVKAAQVGSGGVYLVVELSFSGPSYSPKDAPAKNVDFWVEFEHESGSPKYKIHGFWDGNGSGGANGNVFKVRFCPTKTGKWYLKNVYSNKTELNNEKEGDYVTATSSGNHGFWIPDENSAGGRWFKRSDGSHQYIVGNTTYDFLSKPNGREATKSSIESDIAGIASRNSKVRFCLQSFRSENQSSSVLPFVNSSGGQSDREGTDGDRVNPAYWYGRVDAAVKKGLQVDLICDLILGGTIEDQAVDNQTYMKYVVARYGAYPNVWITVGQEWNEQVSASHEKNNGNYLRTLLAYPIPLSTHATGSWSSGLNGTWNTHAISQGKINDLSDAAARIMADYTAANKKPAINDENGYDPGEATELDVLEGVLGSFAGGGYGTTGHKSASKKGGYFWGFASQGWSVSKQPSTDNLDYMRDAINNNMKFWNYTPRGSNLSIFSNANSGFRVLEWANNEYVLCSDASASGVKANLPSGTWKVVQYNIESKSTSTLSTNASGTFSFNVPNSRACMTLFVKQGGGDTTPPPAPGLNSPTDNIETADQTPAFSWNSVSDASGIKNYEINIDGNVYDAGTSTNYTPASNLSYGSHTWKVRATDNAGLTGNYSSSRTIVISSPKPVITSPACGGSFAPLDNVTLTGSGTSLSWSVEVVGGATLKTATGSSISFTVPVNLSNGDQISATLNGTGGSDACTYSIVDAIPRITTVSEDIDKAYVNAAFSDDIEAVDGDAPLTWSATGLPEGLTLSASGGTLSGIPTKTGIFTFTVTVLDNDNDSDSKALTIEVLDAPPSYCEQGGMVVIEAENYMAGSQNGDVLSWKKATSVSGYSGSGYVTTPDNGSNNPSWGSAAALKFDINFSTTGNYTIWLLRNQTDGAANSAYVGMNGSQTGSTFDNGGGLDWMWVKHSSTVNVGSAGVKTFELRRREDGYSVDKIILTKNASYTPSGNGQAESNFGCEELFNLSVNFGSGDGEYTEGTDVNIVADPAPACKMFDKWIGDVQYLQSVTSAATSLIIPVMNISVTATYKNIPGYALTLTDATASSLSCPQGYFEGEKVTVTANAAPAGLSFVGWEGDVQYLQSASSATTILTMPAQAVSLTAKYDAIPRYTLTVTNGSGSGDYVAGANVTVVANSPQAGERFVSWTGDIQYLESATAATGTLVMPAANITITATYAEDVPNGNLLVWDTEGSGGLLSDNADHVHAELNSSELIIGSGLMAINYSPGNGFGVKGMESVTLTEAIASNEYISFTVSSKNDKSVSISSISIRPFSQNEIRTFAVLSSHSGFASDKVIGSVSYKGNLGSTDLIQIPVDSHTKVSSDIEFRIYIYGYNNKFNAAGIGASGAGDDLVVEGSLSGTSVTTYTLTVVNGSGSGDYPEGANVDILADAAPEGMVFDKWIGDRTYLSNNTVTMPATDVYLEAVYTLVPSQLISNVTANSSRVYQWAENLSVGDVYYTDRTYNVNSLLVDIEGAEFIMTPNSDKGLTSENVINFSLNANAVVYIAFDIRATSLPNWMSNFSYSGKNITTDDQTLKLYSAIYSAGLVTLGGNKASGSAGAGSNYFVIAVPLNGSKSGSLVKKPSPDIPVLIYPNPATDFVTISSPLEMQSISLMDISGKVLELKSFEPGTFQFEFDISKYKVGVYLLDIKTIEFRNFEKILIQK